MNTNNVSIWWRSLPESIRLKLYGHGVTDILQEPDTSVRAALYKYARLRTIGTEKDKNKEHSLLNEVACGLSGLALAGNNRMALADMLTKTVSSLKNTRNNSTNSTITMRKLWWR